MKKLIDYIKEIGGQGLCVAFSGGADSTLLLKLAVLSSPRTVAVTFSTMLHPKAEIEEAQKIASELGAEHYVIYVDEFSDPDIMANSPLRCYHCKRLLFSRLKEFAADKGIFTIIDGTNADDLNEYRPGLRALGELGIISPLARCGVTKKEVRAMLAEFGIAAATKPSAPCLATRLPYNTTITKQVIEKIDKAEGYLKSLGFIAVRVRTHDNIARIEVPRRDFDSLLENVDDITVKLKSLGYDYVTLDLTGLRSGSMDIGISKEG